MTSGATRHIPVLGVEAVALLDPHAGGVYVDATFGAGGYSHMILAQPGTSVIGIDRDRSAIAGGFDLVEQSGGRLTLVEDRFSNLAEICTAQGLSGVDGVVMDVGVSSMQLDQAERGFSFRHDGPLDMRMGSGGPSAADVVARASEADLAKIIYIFGEERHSRAVARAIVAARKDLPITTTRALADIIGKVVWSKPGDIHPATRTFQALRIFVNEELDELHLALSAAEQVLKPGGRLAVVSFHSLEDRIVKAFMVERSKAGGGSRHLPQIAASAPRFSLLTKRPVTAGEAELAANPRARSAKLRGAERTDAPAIDDVALPAWPVLADVMRRLTMRLIHLLVIGVLVFAAAYVYRIKMESTARTERVLRLHAEAREQRDAIAALRAEWSKLDAPQRLQGLAERHTTLKPIAANQFDQFKNLPERPPSLVPPGESDPIGAMIEIIDPDIITGSLPAPPDTDPSKAAEDDK